MTVTSPRPLSRPLSLQPGSTTPAHVDEGLLTLVYAPRQRAVLLTPLGGGAEVPVELADDAVLVFVGHAVSAALERRVWPVAEGVEHRVEADRLSRTSLAFKLRTVGLPPLPHPLLAVGTPASGLFSGW